MNRFEARRQKAGRKIVIGREVLVMTPAPVPSQWIQILRAFLYQPPFLPAMERAQRIEEGAPLYSHREEDTRYY
jgi:hypothetical protein